MFKLRWADYSVNAGKIAITGTVEEVVGLRRDLVSYNTRARALGNQVPDSNYLLIKAIDNIPIEGSGDVTISLYYGDLLFFLDMDRYFSVKYLAGLFGLPTGDFTSRRTFKVTDFLYYYTVPKENMDKFANFLEYNFNFTVNVLKEYNGKDIQYKSPVRDLNLLPNSFVVNENGVYKIVFKEVPSSSKSIREAVDTYKKSLEVEYEQAHRIISDMINKQKQQMKSIEQKAYSALFATLQDIINLGYILRQHDDRIYFYKEEPLVPDSIIIQGKLYKLSELKAVEELISSIYSDWLKHDGKITSIKTNNKAVLDALYNLSLVFGDYFDKRFESYIPFKYYINDLYIESSSIFLNDTGIVVFTGSGYHANVRVNPESNSLYSVCVGDLQMVHGAYAKMSLIAKTLKTMNADSPYNNYISTLYREGLTILNNVSDYKIEGKSFLEETEFHTLA